MTVKATFFFEGGDEGWSETYFHSSATPALFFGAGDGTVTPASPAGLLLGIRLGLVHPYYSCKHVRASQLGSPRTVLVYDLPAAYSFGTFPAPAAGPGAAEVYSSLLVNLGDGGAHRKRLYMGGLPDRIISGPQNYAPTGTWITRFNALRALIVGGSYQLISRPPVAGASNVTSFVVSASGLGAQVTPVPAGAPAVGVPFVALLRGMRYPRGWGGAHPAVVQVIGGVNTVVIGPLRKTHVSSPVWDVFSGGTIENYVTVANTIVSVVDQKIVSRRRGRPFGVPRGRRA
jgi:hypothetical protein